MQCLQLCSLVDAISSSLVETRVDYQILVYNWKAHYDLQISEIIIKYELTLLMSLKLDWKNHLFNKFFQLATWWRVDHHNVLLVFVQSMCIFCIILNCFKHFLPQTYVYMCVCVCMCLTVCFMILWRKELLQIFILSDFIVTQAFVFKIDLWVFIKPTCFWAVKTTFMRFIYCEELSLEPLIT